LDYAYKAILSYKGTHYCGWQTQTVNPNTVQQILEETLAIMMNHRPVRVIGASRTDKGVHANGQVVKIMIPKNVHPVNLIKGLNFKLPNDIRILSCEVAVDAFNPLMNVELKEYHYFFSTTPIQNASLAENIYYIEGNENFDIDKMKSACELIKGRNNFIHFCTLGARKVDPSREVLDCSIQKTTFGPAGDDVYYLKIIATGFLKYMIRFIMNYLIRIANGTLSLDELEMALTGKGNFNNQKKKKAPPHGLHLQRIQYLK
jgi:tRNA pseudouridine38-40 synthase